MCFAIGRASDALFLNQTRRRSEPLGRCTCTCANTHAISRLDASGRASFSPSDIGRPESPETRETRKVESDSPWASFCDRNMLCERILFLCPPHHCLRLVDMRFLSMGVTLSRVFFAGFGLGWGESVCERKSHQHQECLNMVCVSPT